MAEAVVTATTTTKTPYIRRDAKAPATGARFMPGRATQATSYNPEQMLFFGVPFYDKVVRGDGNTIAGVPFGPGTDSDPNPKGELDKFKLEDGARIIHAGSTTDSRTVMPVNIKIGENKRRKQIYQFSLEKRNDVVVILPEKKGEFVFEIWTGFYNRNQLDRARILTQDGKFLHGAGPFQGSTYVTADETASTTGLVKKIGALADGQAQEIAYRVGMTDGIPLWQAYYFVAEYSSKDSQAVLVRQLHDAYLLTCAGGVAKVRKFAAEQMAHSYNDAGIPVSAKR